MLRSKIHGNIKFIGQNVIFQILASVSPYNSDYLECEFQEFNLNFSNGGVNLGAVRSCISVHTPEKRKNHIDEPKLHDRDNSVHGNYGSPLLVSPRLSIRIDFDWICKNKNSSHYVHHLPEIQDNSNNCDIFENFRAQELFLKVTLNSYPLKDHENLPDGSHLIL